MQEMQQCLYTRYAFSAPATIIDSSGSETPAQLTNISLGGCRLVTDARVSVGARLIIKVQLATDRFEAPGTVVHCAEGGVGVIFHNESRDSLLVLNKWIRQTLEPLRYPREDAEKALPSDRVIDCKPETIE
jgi:hypothetical protein